MPCDQAAASDTQNLCMQHCQSDKQSVDQHPNPLLVPLLVPVCDLASADALAVASRSTQYYSHALLARVTAPPLAVQHCRFLI
jgi:hypothetical protein